MPSLASENAVPAASTAIAPKRKQSSLWRWTKRVAVTFLALSLLYALAASTLSRIPVNRDFVQSNDGIEIAVISNGIHIDLALPLRNEHYDWMTHFRSEDVLSYDPNAKFAIFGWGERTFYLETPTWGDIKPHNVLRAFCGAGRSVMHVDLASWRPVESDSCRYIRISPAQYQTLCRKMLETIQVDEFGRAKVIAGAHYHQEDAFYEANGQYHVFHTCNAWAGDSLRSSGVRMGVWTPTTGGVFACLPPADP